MIKQILKAVLAIILAIVVFYISLCWTSACWLERQVEKIAVEVEKQ